MRVAIVGAGRMGRIRAAATKASGGQVVAVCDTDALRAESLAAHVAAPVVVSNWRDLPWGGFESLFVCVPPGCRGGIEVSAIEQGIALFVEKPIGVSVEAVSGVLAALERRPGVTAVGYMNRYRRSVLRTRDAIGDSRIVALSCDWLGTRYKVPWWTQPDLSGGPLNEQATHLVDLGRFIAGEIESVQCTLSTDSAVHGCASASCNLRFRSGALYSLLYSCDVATKMIGLRVFTVDREFRLHGWDFVSAQDADDAQPTDRNAIFYQETGAFLDAAAGTRPAAILSDYRDAARTQSVVDALRRAACSGEVERVR